MKFSTLALALGVGRCYASFWASSWLSPWRVLPTSDCWGAILQSFRSAKEIPNYVAIYMEPFRELQAAERSANVSAATIQNSVILLLDLSLQAVARFNLTEDSFNRKHASVLRAALNSAVAPFSLPDADQLRPVFRKSSASRFLYQRLDDMIVSAKTYKGLQDQRNDFARYLRTAQLQFKQWTPNQFLYILPLNLDLNVVQDYSSGVLSARYSNASLGTADIKDMVNKLRSLGSGAIILAASTTLLVMALSIGLFFQFLY